MIRCELTIDHGGLEVIPVATIKVALSSRCPEESRQMRLVTVGTAFRDPEILDRTYIEVNFSTEILWNLDKVCQRFHISSISS